MSETKFTPGPWRVADYDNDNELDINQHKFYLFWEGPTRWGYDPFSYRVVFNGIKPLAFVVQEACVDDAETAEENEKEGFKIASVNAHLIAAAPDLYYELEKLIDYLEQERLIPDTDSAKAALSKARGEKQ